MCNKNREQLDKIQLMREKMIEAAKVHGLASKETIQFSQELDKLIYEYQCLQKQSNTSGAEIKFVIQQTMLVWPKALLSI